MDDNESIEDMSTNISSYQQSGGAKLNFRSAGSKRTRQLLGRATMIASLSTQRHKHGAVIVKGGNVISVGVNRHKNNPAIFGDTAQASLLRRSSVHAEVAAIKAASSGGRVNLSGAVIYVARVNNSGEQMMSKPCDDCQQRLREAGIKKVYYTVDSELGL